MSIPSDRPVNSRIWHAMLCAKWPKHVKMPSLTEADMSFHTHASRRLTKDAMNEVFTMVIQDRALRVISPPFIGLRYGALTHFDTLEEADRHPITEFARRVTLNE